MAVQGGPKLELITVCLLCVLGVITSAEVFRPLTNGTAMTAPAAGQTPSAGGGRSTSQSASHEQMLALLRQVADETPDTNFFIGDGPARDARKKLAALPATSPGPARWLAQVRVAQEELRLGNEAEAIRHLTEALQLVRGAGAQVDPSWLNETLYRLGVANLRWAETQNCALHPTANSCILPLRDDGIHSQQTPARQAISVLTELLDNQPGPPMDLGAQWLLNIAYMTVGDYPQEIPEPYVIPPHVFESDEEIPRFTNIAPRLGLNLFDMCGGAIVDDFDGDGYLDFVVSTWGTDGQIRLFTNNQDGTFSDNTEQAGLIGIYGGLNMVQADYDNDGSVDVLVLRGAWLLEHGRHPNSLLHNNGDGTFTDVTFDAGLGRVHYPTQTASWGDYDNDGDLDLYVGNESSSAVNAPSQLFRNDGDGAFTDVAAEAGVLNDRYAKAVIWGDYDNDRWLDLYVSNNEGANRLYRNDGDGTFTDVAEQLGVVDPNISFPAWFWDVDNDGVLDLYVTAYVAGIQDLAASALDLPAGVELARLYRGTGDGRFEEVADRYNLAHPAAPMGSNFGDLDNDGYLDFYLGTGYPNYQSVMPNVMYRNLDGNGFTNVTYAGGFGHLQKGHAVAFADLDHDGDQDVFEQMGGAFPGDQYGNVLYENPGFGNHWTTIKLVGVRSNRSGIGARIRAEIIEDGTRRSIYRYVNSGGTFGGNPLRQTLGLGRATRIEVLEIFWPTTGLTQTFTDVPVDQVIRIVEGDRSYATVEVKTMTLGQEQRGNHGLAQRSVEAGATDAH